MKPMRVLTYEQAEEIMKRAFKYAHLQYHFGCDATDGMDREAFNKSFDERQQALDNFKDYVHELTMPAGLTDCCDYFNGYKYAVRDYYLNGEEYCKKVLKDFSTEVERTPSFDLLHLGYADGYESCVFTESA